MEYNDLTLSELKKIAKENNIVNISRLSKSELIEVLKEEINIEDNLNDGSNSYKLTNEGDEIIEGILEVLPDGYGFLRGDNYLPSPKDVYVSPVQIRRFRLETGDKKKVIPRTPKE